MTARLYTLDPLEDFRPLTFAGHKNAVLNAYFSSNSKSVSVSQGYAIHPINHCDPIRYTLLAVTVLCSSGEPRRPMISIVVTRQIRRILRLLAFVGGFINDTTLTSPTQRSSAVRSTRPQGCSSSAFRPGSSVSGRCPRSRICIP
jgi:hypothetical protein